MPNLFAEERRLIMDCAISHTDAENLVLKTWMAMTLGLAGPSNEQLGRRRTKRSDMKDQLGPAQCIDRTD